MSLVNKLANDILAAAKPEARETYAADMRKAIDGANAFVFQMIADAEANKDKTDVNLPRS